MTITTGGDTPTDRLVHLCVYWSQLLLKQGHNTFSSDELITKINDLVEQFYDLPGNTQGGLLHVVLDDCNWGADKIEHAREEARRAGDQPAFWLSTVLILLSHEERLQLAATCPCCKNPPEPTRAAPGDVLAWGDGISVAAAHEEAVSAPADWLNQVPHQIEDEPEDRPTIKLEVTAAAPLMRVIEERANGLWIEWHPRSVEALNLPSPDAEIPSNAWHTAIVAVFAALGFDLETTERSPGNSEIVFSITQAVDAAR